MARDDVVTKKRMPTGVWELRNDPWLVWVDEPNDDYGQHRDVRINWNGIGATDWHNAMRHQNIMAEAIALAKRLEADHRCKFKP